MTIRRPRESQPRPPVGPAETPELPGAPRPPTEPPPAHPPTPPPIPPPPGSVPPADPKLRF